MYFRYNEEETEYLKSKCKKLAFVIDAVGHIKRPVDKDLFSAVVHHIVGQQISTKAQATIWRRIQEDLKPLNAETVLKAGIEKLQSFGITFKKAEYIKDFANKIKNGEFDLEAAWQKSDAEVIKELSSLKGVGVWTAEMLLLFCMERKNVFSYDDLAIQRGIRMVYHHKKITKTLFEKYKKRFSPYCSVASLYFWAVAGGAVDGMKDRAPTNKKLSENKPQVSRYKIMTNKENKTYFKTIYKSPLGNITLACDGKENLVGLWIEGQKYFGDTVNCEMTENNNIEIFKKTKNWLDRYFKGEKPEISELPLAPIGNDFRQRVWRILCEIPYGQVCTYGDIAKIIAKERGRAKMSAQAVGGAVGHNPISVIIPCHRVVSSNGSLTGYSGGIKTKIKLLKHEGVNMEGLFTPKNSTAP